MSTNILVTASALSDQDLLARLEMFAGKEREASAELVAQLAALDSRRMLYAAQGYGSLFSYCTQALRLSEDAACNRIWTARASLRFPLILDLLASGSMTLTSVRLLGPHLTAENHQSVLARAMDRTRREIEALVAELAPKRDLPSTVRKLPSPRPTAAHSAWAGPRPASAGPAPAPGPWPELAVGPAPGTAPAPAAAFGPAITSVPSAAGTAIAPSPSPMPATSRPIVRASAPERYRVQFTIGQETHEKLRRLQALLRREIPDGDPGAIFDRALTLLLEKVEKTKLAAAAKPRPRPSIHPTTDAGPLLRPATNPSRLIRPETDPNPPIRPSADKEVREHSLPSRSVPATPPSRSVPAAPLSRNVPAVPPSRTVPAPPARSVPATPPSRSLPREVRREVWRRDAGRCAFVSPTGRRCTESTFLEFHHIQPYAKQGPATVANISLRCRRHNQYEAQLIFGPHDRPVRREARPSR
jgi:5-methylcytosine-specific restriction endonuclease McrA